ncbi:MAG: Na+/H+ antiporter NhaA, partial [Tabrizicola sp.]
MTRFARALLGGAGLATLWVNLAPASYYDSIEWRLLDLPGWIVPLPISVTLRTLVSDGLMALFLFIVGKELWEALVAEHGSLKGRRAALPAGRVLGGVVGAALVWTLSA